MKAEDDLQKIRESIDALDIQLQDLLNERAELARQVAQAKGDQADAGQYYRPEREAEVLRQVVERNKGPLTNEQVTALFREIMSACLAQQKSLTVAYLGPAGTFTQAAVNKQFGHAVRQKPQESIEAVFREVEADSSHFGVVPVENSAAGGISHTLDRFIGSPLKICGEIELRIHHHLLSNEAELASVTRVYGHEQALAQCRQWLDVNLPAAERVPAASNAEGARLAVGNQGAAAIAGDAAAELYQLQPLVTNIEDEPDNTTRFLVIGRQVVASSGHDKTSVMFSTPNQPGALQKMLSIFADADISMTRVESRPSRESTWAYLFFVDLEGHADDANLKSALARLETEASMMQVLGSYPRAVP